MIIRSLRLKNYRRFVECEIEFPEGIIGLVGNNGAGKSTLMEAISWALFGNNAARSGKEEIRHSSSAPGDECQVILDFELDNEPFRVVRQLRGRSAAGDASIFSGKNLLAKSTTAVNNEVQNLLGLDLKNFEISFFAKQKELNALSDLTPGEREKHIIKLLGISDVDAAIKLLREDKREDSTKIDVNEAVIAEISVTANDLELAEKELALLQATIVEEKSILERLRGAHDQVSAEFDGAMKQRKLYLEIKSGHDILITQIDNGQKRLKELQLRGQSLIEYKRDAAILKGKTAKYDEAKQFVELQNELALQYSKLISNRTMRDQLMADHQKLEEYISQLQGEQESLSGIDSMIAEKELIFKQLYRNRERFQELNARKIHFQTQIENNNMALHNLRKQADILRKCNEEALELEVKTEVYDGLKAALEDLNEAAMKHAALSTAKKNWDKLAADLHNLNAYINEMATEIANLEGITDAYSLTETQLSSTSIMLKSHNLVLNSLEAENKSLQNAQIQVDKQLAEIGNLGPESKCDRCLRPFGEYYGEIRTHFENELRSIATARSELESKLVNIKEIISIERDKKKSLEEEISRLSNERARIGQIQIVMNREIGQLKTLERGMQEFEREIAGIGDVSYDLSNHLHIKEEFERTSKYRDQYLQLRARIKSLEDIPDTINELESVINILSENKAVVGNDLSLLDYNESRLVKTEEELRELNNSKARLTQIRQTLEREQLNRLSIEGKISEVESVIANYAGLQYRREDHERARIELNELSKLRDDYLKLDALIKSMEDVPSLIAEASRGLEDLNKMASECLEHMANIGYSDEIFARIEKGKEEARSQCHQAELGLRDSASELKLKEQQLINLKTEVNRKASLCEEVEALKKNRSTLRKLEGILDDFRTDLIGRIRPALSQRAQYYLELLTDGKYSEMEISEGYSLYIYDDGRKYEIERYSGGEKDIANLCLRLAISELTRESRESVFSFIVLDEIFGSLDDIRRNAVLLALGNLKKHFRQIFVITHIEDIKDRLEYTILVEERPGGTSTISFL